MPAHMLWDADEGYYARTAAEMLKSGNWLVPTYNGEIFAHKPPLSFWLMAIAMKIFGEGEFAVRFFSGPAMAGSGFLTYLIGRRLFDERTGIWAMGVLVTSLMAVYLGFAAMLDAVLLFCVTLSIWAYVELSWRPQQNSHQIFIFGLGIYLSLLAKGPVGPVVVLSTVTVSWLFMPRAQRLPLSQGLALLAMSVVAFLAFLGWAIPADRASAGNLLREGFSTHVIGRALSPMEGHGGQGPIGYLLSLPAYLPFLLLGFFPWIIHLPAALYGFATGRFGDRRARILLGSWTIPTLLVFTLAATKLPHYIFPIYPALAIIVAALITQHTGNSVQLLRWRQCGAALYFAGALLTAVAIIASPRVMEKPPSWTVILAFSLAIAGLAMWIARTQISGKLLAVSRLLVFTTPMAFAGLFWLIIKPIEPTIKLALPMAHATAKASAEAHEIYMAGFSEPSFYFYLNRPPKKIVKQIPENDAGLQQALSNPHSIVLVAPQSLIERALLTTRGRSLEVVATFSAHNINRGGRYQTMIVARLPSLPKS